MTNRENVVAWVIAEAHAAHARPQQPQQPVSVPGLRYASDHMPRHTGSGVHTNWVLVARPADAGLVSSWVCVRHIRDCKRASPGDTPIDTQAPATGSEMPPALGSSSPTPDRVESGGASSAAAGVGEGGVAARTRRQSRGMSMSQLAAEAAELLGSPPVADEPVVAEPVAAAQSAQSPSRAGPASLSRGVSVSSVVPPAQASVSSPRTANPARPAPLLTVAIPLSTAPSPVPASAPALMSASPAPMLASPASQPPASPLNASPAPALDSLLDNDGDVSTSPVCGVAVPSHHPNRMHERAASSDESLNFSM